MVVGATLLTLGKAKGWTTNAVGSYTLGPANGVGSPLFVGGVEVVGGNGTATFTQNCGTNAIVGGGDFQGNRTAGDPYDSTDAMLILGFYGGLQPLGRHLGNGVGTYNLNGGLLTGGTFSDQNHYGTEYLGIGGTAIFNESGGTNSFPGYVFVGDVRKAIGKAAAAFKNPSTTGSPARLQLTPSAAGSCLCRAAYMSVTPVPRTFTQNENRGAKFWLQAVQKHEGVCHVTGNCKEINRLAVPARV